MKQRTMLGALVAAGAIATWAGGARADLVTNGNFASGDFTGWMVSGNGIMIDSNYPNTGDTNDVAFFAQTGDPNPGVLSQTLMTAPGQSYNLSFALLDNPEALGSDTFLVNLGVFSTTIYGDQAGAYSNGPNPYVSFLVPGIDISGTSAVLSFEGLIDSTGLNALLGGNWYLDDVSVTPALSGASGVPGPVIGVGPPGIVFAAASLLLWLRRHRKTIGIRWDR